MTTPAVSPPLELSYDQVSCKSTYRWSNPLSSSSVYTSFQLEDGLPHCCVFGQMPFCFRLCNANPSPQFRRWNAQAPAVCPSRAHQRRVSEHNTLALVAIFLAQIQVAIKERTIPKTTSGKIQRRLTRTLRHDGDLQIVEELSQHAARRMVPPPPPQQQRQQKHQQRAATRFVAPAPRSDGHLAADSPPQEKSNGKPVAAVRAGSAFSWDHIADERRTHGALKPAVSYSAAGYGGVDREISRPGSCAVEPFSAFRHIWTLKQSRANHPLVRLRWLALKLLLG